MKPMQGSETKTAMLALIQLNWHVDQVEKGNIPAEKLNETSGFGTLAALYHLFAPDETVRLLIAAARQFGLVDGIVPYVLAPLACTPLGKDLYNCYLAQSDAVPASKGEVVWQPKPRN